MINKAGNVYHFVYDPTASVPAVVYEEGPTYRYLNVPSPGGSLICREKYEQNGQSLKLTESHTYHEDGLGSTLAMTDQTGDPTDKYSYDAWGNATHGTGTTADNPYQYVGGLGYYSHHQESTLGLLQLGVRYYDPSLGRFTQRDRVPVPGESEYVYSWDNPGAKLDPSGMKCWRADTRSGWLCRCLVRLLVCLDNHRINDAIADLDRGHLEILWCDHGSDLTPGSEPGEYRWRPWPFVSQIRLGLWLFPFSCSAVAHELSHAYDGYFSWGPWKSGSEEAAMEVEAEYARKQCDRYNKVCDYVRRHTCQGHTISAPAPVLWAR